MPKKTVRVAACQLLSSDRVEENVLKVINFIELCAEYKIDIIAFPGFSTYNFTSFGHFHILLRDFVLLNLNIYF